MIQGPSQSIGIIGGSIAALVAGIGLRQHGYNVTILERALSPHDGRGVGIALPGTLVKTCIELGFFDADVPRLQTTSLLFFNQR